MTETVVALPMRLEASEIDLVKRTIAAGASDEELKLFLFDCKRQGVHPLDKLIHFSKRGGRYTPITSIDFMRMRAAETGELAGNDDPTFTFKDGEPAVPISASVTVYRLTQGMRYPYTATARWVEYFPGDREGFMWRKMPQLMLGKCAEALALRKAFPKQLHGIYERAEMAQAGSEPEPTRGVTPSGPSSHDGTRTEPPAREQSEADQADMLLPKPAEDRGYLVAEIKKLGKHIPAGDKAQAAITYLGDGVELEHADVAALADLLRWCQARAKK